MHVFIENVFNIFQFNIDFHGDLDVFFGECQEICSFYHLLECDSIRNIINKR